VSVPAEHSSASFEIRFEQTTWAFGEVRGAPRTR
jgi:hypothetical protein